MESIVWTFEAKLNVSNLHKYAQLPEWSEIEKAITEGTQIKERSVKNNSTFNDARHRLKWLLLLVLIFLPHFRVILLGALSYIMLSFGSLSSFKLERISYVVILLFWIAFFFN